MEGLGFIILTLAAVSVLLPVAFIAYVNIGGSYRPRKDWRARKTDKQDNTSVCVCSVDTDCPPGYVCINGHCVPSRS